jgi:hypothetical protein
MRMLANLQFPHHFPPLQVNQTQVVAGRICHVELSGDRPICRPSGIGTHEQEPKENAAPFHMEVTKYRPQSFEKLQ